ncbi:MAG: carbohydrate porin [Planctomycetota bacterium]
MNRILLLTIATMLIATVSRAQDQPWLLGDWNGKRQALAEQGFEFEFVLTLEGVQNVAGGIARSSRGLANLDLVMDAWGKALGLSEDGDLHLYLLGNAGGFPGEMIGDVQLTSNIEAPEAFKVFEAWWRQRYADDRIAWLLGLHDYNALFDSLDTAGHFVHSSFGISPDISQLPPSIFPTTSLAFIVSLFSDEGGYLHLGAYDGVAGDPRDPKGTRIVLDSDDGIFYALEGGIHNDQTNSKLAVGGWYRTTDFEAEFSGRNHRDNSGVYLIGETALTDRWAGFFQLGNADRHRNQIGFYAGAGLVHSPVIMEDDLFGVGVAYARNSDEYLDFNPGADDYEMAIECTYKFNPNPWLILQPGVHFIKNPGMDPDLDDAVALSFRAYMSF